MKSLIDRLVEQQKKAAIYGASTVIDLFAVGPHTDGIVFDLSDDAQRNDDLLQASQDLTVSRNRLEQELNKSSAKR